MLRAFKTWAATCAWRTYGCPGIKYVRSLRMQTNTSSLHSIACRLPFEMLYPTGRSRKMNSRVGQNRQNLYEADIIAVDFHYISTVYARWMQGKMIVTNTDTNEE
jgi:hypothetical protein